MKILLNRMKLIRERVILILLFSVFTTSLIAQSNIDFLRTVKTYQDSVKLVTPRQTPQIIDTTTFNINTYLRIFNKLKLPSDLKCQYTYRYDGTSGDPMLYVVKDSFDLESYLEKECWKFFKRNNFDTTNITPKTTNLFKRIVSLYGYAYEYNAKKYIIPEDSKAGYLQYLYFNQFGEVFALYWHSAAGQKSVIYSNNELKQFYNNYLKTDLFSYDKEKFKGLLNLNPSPIIEMGKNSCLITWYEIMTHSGIYKRTYEISRSTPYTVVKKEDIKILEINADFLY